MNNMIFFMVDIFVGKNVENALL